MDSGHTSVQCDGCNVHSFRYRRYVCLRCINYDLCGCCFDEQRETNSHKNAHPMQCIILSSDESVFFSNNKLLNATFSFTCPICGSSGFAKSDLGTHVFEAHPDSRVKVICPLCTLQCAVGDRVTKHLPSFPQHLVDVHSFKKPESVTTTTNRPVSILKPSSIFQIPNDGDSSGYEDLSSLHQGEENYVKRHGRRRARRKREKVDGFNELAGLLTLPLDGKRYRLRSLPASSTAPFEQRQHVENGATYQMRPQTAIQATKAFGLAQKGYPSDNDKKQPRIHLPEHQTVGEQRMSNMNGNQAAAGDSQPAYSDNTNNCNTDDSTVPTPLEEVSRFLEGPASSQLLSSHASVSSNVIRFSPPLLESGSQPIETHVARKSLLGETADVYSSEWRTFVEELMFDSLRITGLSALITPKEDNGM